MHLRVTGAEVKTCSLVGNRGRGSVPLCIVGNCFWIENENGCGFRKVVGRRIDFNITFANFYSYLI